MTFCITYVHKKHSKPPRQIYMTGTFKVRPGVRFFSNSPLFNVWDSSCSPTRKERGGRGGVNSVISVSKWFNNKRNDHDEITKYRKH